MATWFLSLILTVCFVLKVTDGQAHRFVLNEVTYPNGSTVLRTDIGEGAAALNCTTDKTTCCTNMNGETRAGDFYFPNGSMVATSGSAPSNSYYRSRSSMLISLNRRPTATQTGQFRCEIPDASRTNVNLFINIVDISLSITTSGTNTAGETYSLECSATVTGSTDQRTITWLDQMNNPVPSGMVTTTGSMSTLTFNPLAASHAGAYTCRVTAGGVTETQTYTVIVNAVSISLSITTSGTNIAGATYSLECSATVTGSTDQPTITWLDPMNNPVLSGMVTTTGSMNTLTFNPLAASHAGTYTCRVTAGDVTETQTSTVDVNVITAQVTRSSNGPLTAGQTGFSLSCDVAETENLNTPTFTYQWRRNGGVISGQQENTLSLSPLTASNAGDYNCSVTVSSTSLSSTVTVNSGNTETVSIQLPAPTSVTVTNGSVNVGSTVTLTCSVELSPALDVPVTVNTVWTGPDGFRIANTAQQMGNSDTYISTTMVTNDYSGDYTCTATVTSTSPFITSSTGTPSPPLRIIIGVYLSLKGVVYPNNSVILITEISETNTTSNNGLQCITDRRPCCRSANRHGEWFFPDDGGIVPPIGSATTFHRNRGDDGTVNLNRLNNDVMMPTGRFCCVVPDATSTDVTLCANIVLDIPTTLPPSMSNTTNAAQEPQITSSSISDPTAAPPLNVQATQSSASAPVEVSWSPSSSGATNITGYRIFYGNGKNVSVPSFVTRIILTLNKDSVGETVSVRSEADQLASQLITVTVTTPTEAATKSSCSSALDVGLTFGVMLLLLCVVSVVFTLVLIFMWRNRRVGENDSTNMPTQLYEDPDKLTSRGQGNYELTQCPAYESTTTRPEPPPTQVDQSSHYEL